MDGATEVKLPREGDLAAGGVLRRWYVSAGDDVAAGEPLCEISPRDGGSADVASPVAGRLERRLVEEGGEVVAGAALARIAEEEEPLHFEHTSIELW